MEGFVYQEDAALRETATRFRGVANRALRGHMGDRVRAFAEEPDEAFTAGPDGRVRWRGAAVARLVATDDPLAPRVEPLPSDLLDAPLKERVRRRLAAWLEAELQRHFGPLSAAAAAAASGAMRGVVFALQQGLGSAPRRGMSRAVSTLTPGEQRELGRLGVSLGRLNVYFPSLLAPEVLQWRALLHGLRQPGPLPGPLGAPSIADRSGIAAAAYVACGYQPAGPRAVRVDRLERLAAAARRAARDGPVRDQPRDAGRGRRRARRRARHPGRARASRPTRTAVIARPRPGPARPCADGGSALDAPRTASRRARGPAPRPDRCPGHRRWRRGPAGGNRRT